MRILLVNSERSMRGGEMQTLSLALGLRDRGHEVHVAVSSAGALSERLRGAIPLTVFRFENIPAGTPYRLARLIERFGPGIVHAQTSRAHTHCRLSRLFLAKPPPIVVSRRVAFPPSRGFFGYLKYRTGIAHYIPISQAAARPLVAAGIPAGRMTIVPSGVDVARFSASRGSAGLLESWGVDRSDFLIASVGAFEIEKGYETLIRAAGPVLERHAAARFFFFGGGSLRGRLERMIVEQGCAGRIRLSAIEHPLEEILPLFDLFVLPSLEEGLSTALIAALAAGLPVVASKTGGIPEVTGEDGAILVPPGSVEALAGAISGLIDDDAGRKKLSEAGRRRAPVFDIGRTVDGILSVYGRVISGRE